MVRKYTSLLAALLITVGLLTPVALAASNQTCQPINNGGSTCSANGLLTIQKFVLNPRTSNYTPNILQTDYVFSRNEPITFRLVVKNISKNAVSGIIMIDTLPANLDFTGGDGTWDAQKRTVSIMLNSLPANKATSYTINAKVNSAALANNQSSVCVSNQALVQTKYFFFFTSTQNQTSSIFCIRKESLSQAQIKAQAQLFAPTDANQTDTSTNGTQTKGGKTLFTASTTSQTPGTGPELWGLLLLPAALFSGLKLRKMN